MKIVQVKISELKPAKYNPRQLSKDQFKKLRESLDEFGFVDPVIVNKRNNVIVGGHQRVKVWADLKNETVPVFWVDLDDKKERELNIRLNANTGSWDTDILANEFSVEELGDWGFDMDLLGIMNKSEPKTKKGGEGPITYCITVTCSSPEEREKTMAFLKKHNLDAEESKK